MFFSPCKSIENHLSVTYDASKFSAGSWQQAFILFFIKERVNLAVLIPHKTIQKTKYQSDLQTGIGILKDWCRKSNNLTQL